MPSKSLPPMKIIDAQSMTGTSVITSTVIGIHNQDNIGLELVWTGTPNGTFQVQGSIDYNLPNSSNAGTWVNLVSGSASGSADAWFVNLNNLPFPWLRVQYTNSSSTGTLNGYASGKAL